MVLHFKEKNNFSQKRLIISKKALSKKKYLNQFFNLKVHEDVRHCQSKNQCPLLHCYLQFSLAVVFSLLASAAAFFSSILIHLPHCYTRSRLKHQ